MLLGAVLLAAVSWRDDVRGLPPAARLIAQLAAVALALVGQVAAGPVFQGWLPGWLDAIATLLLWVWFINLFNFSLRNTIEGSVDARIVNFCLSFLF